MKKRIYFLLLAICSLTFGLSHLSAQEATPLPNDPRVKSGTTANGLNYIIITNAAQKGNAHFCIAQKVGTSLEKGNNLGSFLLLEQLATQGTRNFQGDAVTSYLKKIGVSNDNIKFETQPDRLIYSIKDVPTGRQNTIDSALLILYNWMCAINIDEEDMAQERAVLKSRLLTSKAKADNRLNIEEIKALYPDSPYTNGLGPDNINAVNSLNSRDLRNFYYTWCRPDLQCVIVVGDVDAAKVETQIKSLFSTIPKPAKTQKREYYKIPQFPGVKSVVLKDKEYNKTTVEITMLKQPLKDEYKKTNLPYIQDYMDDAVFFLLQNRIRDGVVEQGLPIYDVEINKGIYLGIDKTDAYSITFQTLPSSVYQSVAFVSNELKKILRTGFSRQEFNSTIDLYWKRLENGYDNRSTFANDIYLQRALNAYFNGYSLASTEMNFEIMKDVLYSIGMNDLNNYAQALLSQENNVVICCKMPDAPGVAPINENRLEHSLTDALSHDIGTSSQKTATWPEVVLTDNVEVTEQEEDGLSGEKVFVLSNGARVVLKNANVNGDTISFRAVSNGGFSLLKGVNIGNRDFFNDVLNISKIGGVGISEMKRLYAYNHMDLDCRISPSTEEIYGWSTSAALDKLLDGIYLNFTQRGEDKTAYDVYKQRIIYYTQYNSISPEGIFTDSVNYYNNSNKKFVETIKPSEIEAYNYSTLHKNLSSRFSNAADFTFIFVGDSLEQYLPEIAQHIGNIPGNPEEKETSLLLPNYRTKGNVSRRFFAKMRVPTTFADVTYSMSCAPSNKTFLLSRIAENYIGSFINEHLSKTISNIEVKSDLEFYPENMNVLNINFQSDSLNATKALSEIDLQLQNIADGKIDSKEWNKIIFNMAKLFKGEKENAGELINYLSIKYVNDYDLYFELDDIQSITKEDFAQFIKEMLADGNKVSVVMDGTTADIETLRLLKENEFIRQYFDIQ